MNNSVLTANKGLAGGFFLLLILSFTTLTYAKGEDTWQNEITIYGWYAGIDGTVEFPGGAETDISIDTSDILDNLSMIFMGGYEGRYNRWSIQADVVYMDVGGSADKPLVLGATSVDLDVSSWILNGGVGYDIVQSDQGTLAVVGGVRYLTLDIDVDVGVLGTTVTDKSDSEGVLDGIIGIGGFIQLAENWYIPYHADIGTGESDLTWQLFGGIGYRFSWGDIRLGYRFLSYDLEDKLMEDLQISGPVFGVGFRF